jgi:hypothetical protein
MSLKRVLSILILSFLAAFSLGCDSSDQDFGLHQTFQALDAPASLSFLTVPQRVAGTEFSTLRVGILDHTGAPAKTATNAVTIALANPGGATLSGTKTVNAVDGVASFSGLSVDKVGQYTFVASSPGLVGADSSSFVITGGAPNTLTFLVSPPPLPASPLDPLTDANSVGKDAPFPAPLQVEIRDANGNLVTDGSSVTMVVAVNGTGTATLGGTTTVASVNGVATFTDLFIDTGGGAMVLAAVSGDGLATAGPFFVRSAYTAYLTLPEPAPLPNASLFGFDAGMLPPGPLTPIGTSDLAPVGNLVGSFVSHITPHPDGRLILVENSIAPAAALWSVNNASLTLVGPPTPTPLGFLLVDPLGAATPLAGVTGFTIDPNGQVAYAYVTAPMAPALPGLYTVDVGGALPFATATFVGPGIGANGRGLAFDSFNLDPVTGQPAPVLWTTDLAGQLVTIDPATGVATPTGVSTNPGVLNLSISPLTTGLAGLFPGAFGFIDRATGAFTPLAATGTATAIDARVEE